MAAPKSDQLSLSIAPPTQVDGDSKIPATSTVQQQQQEQNQLVIASESGTASRYPRWNKEEIIILVRAKREVDKQEKRGQLAELQNDYSSRAVARWSAVSSYCKIHGVNREPMKCRKRWGNLASDFKKIVEYDARVNNQLESYWEMRSDARRGKKLPGFFERDVYDLMYETAVESTMGDGKDDKEEISYGEAEAEVVFDSGRSANDDEGLFSDYEQSSYEDVGLDERSTEKGDEMREVPIAIQVPAPISGGASDCKDGSFTGLDKQYQPPIGGTTNTKGTNDKQTGSNPEMASKSCEGRKRKRSDTEGGDPERSSLQEKLIRTLERTGKTVKAQLEALNTNLRLEMEDRCEKSMVFLSTLNKLADAISQIADRA